MIGSITGPREWRVVALRRVLHRIEQGWSPECDSRPADAGEWGVLKAGCVNCGKFNPAENKVLPAFLEPRPELKVEPGDLLMSRASGSPRLLGSAAIAGATPSRLMLSDKVFRLRLDEAQARPRFVAYALGSAPVRSQIESAISGADGLANNLPQSAVRALTITLPQGESQDRIADFLDRKTAAIDQALIQRGHQLGLMKHRHNSLIDEVVQNPGGPRVKLKYLVDLLPGFAFPSDGFVLPNEPSCVRLLRGINIGLGELRWDDTVAWPITGSSSFARYQLQAGDLVLGMDRPWIGDGLRLAEVGEVDIPALLLQRVARLRARRGLLQKYLQVVLLSTGFRSYFEPILTGVSVPHISPEQILNFEVRVPELKVQAEICDRVERDAKWTSLLGAAIEAQLAVLREYRQALITAAVTGQIDVAAQEAA